MNLDDLIKLAGIQANQQPVQEEPESMRKIIALVTPEVLNKLQTEEPAEEVEEWGNSAPDSDGPEYHDDGISTLGSDADLSLRRYLGARGSHVVVDENDVYPDHTVEDITEAYASFKEGYHSKKKKKYNEESVNEASCGCGSDCGHCGGKHAESEVGKKCDCCGNMIKEGVQEAFFTEDMSEPKEVELAGDSIWDKDGTNPKSVTISNYTVNEDPDGFATVNVEHDGPWTIYTDSGFEKAVSEMVGFNVSFTEQGMQDDGMASLEGQTSDKIGEEVVDEADVEENAFNQAAAAAAREGKPEFEFGGKKYKTKMDKSTAHKLDDDIDMLRKLAGINQ